jgi:thymidine phosphorylase
MLSNTLKRSSRSPKRANKNVLEKGDASRKFVDLIKNQNSAVKLQADNNVLT